MEADFPRGLDHTNGLEIEFGSMSHCVLGSEEVRLFVIKLTHRPNIASKYYSYIRKAGFGLSDSIDVRLCQPMLNLGSKPISLPPPSNSVIISVMVSFSLSPSLLSPPFYAPKAFFHEKGAVSKTEQARRHRV